MKETMSLVLATAILALGGLGLYMYKQSDDFKDDFSSYSDSDSDSDLELDSDLDSQFEEDFIDYEPKTVKRAKTKRNKTTGGTRKKRY